MRLTHNLYVPSVITVHVQRSVVRRAITLLVRHHHVVRQDIRVGHQFLASVMRVRVRRNGRVGRRAVNGRSGGFRRSGVFGRDKRTLVTLGVGGVGDEMTVS